MKIRKERKRRREGKRRSRHRTRSLEKYMTANPVSHRSAGDRSPVIANRSKTIVVGRKGRSAQNLGGEREVVNGRHSHLSRVEFRSYGSRRKDGGKGESKGGRGGTKGRERLGVGGDRDIENGDTRRGDKEGRKRGAGLSEEDERDGKVERQGERG